MTDHEKATKFKEDLNKLMNHKLYVKDIANPIKKAICLANAQALLGDTKFYALLWMMATDKDYKHDNEELK